jgi:hypothetical protein
MTHVPVSGKDITLFSVAQIRNQGPLSTLDTVMESVTHMEIPTVQTWLLTGTHAGMLVCLLTFLPDSKYVGDAWRCREGVDCLMRYLFCERCHCFV